MSEMSPTRVTTRNSVLRAVLVLAGLVGWLVAAALLWRTEVPGDLELPDLRARDFFTAEELEETADYERFLRIDSLLAALASMVTLAVLAVRAPTIARGMRLGRVGTGVVLGMVALTALWFVSLPFDVAARWWQRRHDLTRGGWLEWLLAPWAELVAGAAFALLTIAILLALAGRFPRRWWLAAAPVFTGLATLFALALGGLTGLEADSIRDPQLRRDARTLARELHTTGTPVEVEEVSDVTRQANAYVIGLGPSERVVLWDTLLDGRFPDPEVRFVLAHEFGHVARDHVWKAVGWYGLVVLPLFGVVAAVTRSRGGLANPATLPLALLVLTVSQFVLLPPTNVISRRFEAEADWLALEATEDPDAARGLFRRFSRTGLSQPNPPEWAYVLFDTHPTLMKRIAMAQAWRERQAANPRRAGSPEGS